MAQTFSGKYVKLRDDLRGALAAGRAAQAADPEDGGTCNFDSAYLNLPRWKEDLVMQAAQEAGGRCFTAKMFGSKVFIFPPDCGGAQANARSVNAEAMAKSLMESGYDASVYYQMD